VVEAGGIVDVQEEDNAPSAVVHGEFQESGALEVVAWETAGVEEGIAVGHTEVRRWLRNSDRAEAGIEVPQTPVLVKAFVKNG
jgi:hypothetical protein